MSKQLSPGRLSQLLGLLPARLHAALDAWSFRLARKRADRRRRKAGLLGQQPQAAGIDYKLRPWRD